MRRRRRDPPRARTPSSAFPPRARAPAGFPAAPEQVADASSPPSACSAPRSLARHPPRGACGLGPGPDRQADFDDVFDRGLPRPPLRRARPRRGRGDAAQPTTRAISTDARAGRGGALGRRGDRRRTPVRAATLTPGDEDAALRAFARALPEALPRRRSRRTASGKGALSDAAPRLPRDDAPRRRGHAPAATRRRHAAAARAAADRRLGQHEGRHRRRAAARPCAGAGRRAGGGLHARHPADPRDPRAAAPQPRSGADAGVGPGGRLGRRHAAGRGAGRVPVRPALRRPRARRAGHRRLRRAGTRRARGADRRDGAAARARLVRRSGCRRWPPIRPTGPRRGR